MPVDEGLAHLSDTLLFWAVAVYAVAMVAFAGEFAFRDRGRTVGRVGLAATVVGWLFHGGSLLARGVAVHRVPWGNMYEFSSSVAFIAVTTFLVLNLRQRIRYLGAFVMVPTVLYLGLAGTVLYVPAGPLQPALDSYWITIHVSAAITATGVFMFSGVATVLYLLKERWERRNPAVSVGPGTATPVEFRRETRGPAPGGRGRRQAGLMRWLPSSATLDRVSYRTIAFAFPIWTFAIIAGAIWAEGAWGRYWGWDPKETMSFVTWVAYAGYLHARATSGWTGRRAAILALIALSALMADYFVVNLWITGKHSYAGL